jgi:serine/threonine protein kinase
MLSVFVDHNIPPTEFREFLFDRQNNRFIKDIKKRSPNKKLLDPADVECIRNEVKAYLRLGSHENIAHLISNFETPEKYVLVYELYATDLFKIANEVQLNTSHLVDIIYQLINGIKYIHNHQIIHCDLKTENVAVDAKGVIKLLDFEFARNFPPAGDVFTDEVGTDEYRAPEMGKHWNNGVDLWCLGVMIRELAPSSKGRLTPHEDSVVQLMRRILRQRAVERLGFIKPYNFSVQLIGDALDRLKLPRERFLPHESVVSYTLPTTAPPIVSPTESLEFVDKCIRRRKLST